MKEALSSESLVPITDLEVFLKQPLYKPYVPLQWINIMNEYRPDRWVILNITSDKHPSVRKVFAGWTGGYLDGDRWKASSGITNITEYDDRYEIDNYSGSRYICYKTSYGMTGYMGAVYSGWMDKITDDEKIEIENNPTGTKE